MEASVTICLFILILKGKKNSIKGVWNELIQIIIFGSTRFIVGFYEAIYQKRIHSYMYRNCIIYRCIC